MLLLSIHYKDLLLNGSSDYLQNVSIEDTFVSIDQKKSIEHLLGEWDEEQWVLLLCIIQSIHFLL
jgi:hypothetical protein